MTSDNTNILPYGTVIRHHASIKGFIGIFRKVHQNEIWSHFILKHIWMLVVQLLIWVLPLCLLQVTCHMLWFTVRSGSLPKTTKTATLAHRFHFISSSQNKIYKANQPKPVPDHSSIENTNLYHSSLYHHVDLKNDLGVLMIMAPKQKKKKSTSDVWQIFLIYY